MKKFLSFIPGFRSGNKIKMTIAIIYYLFSLISFSAGFSFGMILLSGPFVIFYGMRIFARKKFQIRIMQVVVPFLIALLVFSGSFIAFNIDYEKDQQAQQLIAEQQKVEEAEMKAAEEVSIAIAQIDSLPEEVTLTDKEASISARNTYDALNSAQQEQVTNFEKLTLAETIIAGLVIDKEAADKVVAEIDYLPIDLTLAHEETVEATQSAYDNLSDSQKEQVSNLEKLTSAKEKISNEKLAAEKEIAEEKAVQQAVEKKAADERAATQKKSSSSSSSGSSNTSNSSSASAEQSTEVLVTRTGTKYHVRACGNGDYYSATLSEAKARGLTPCKKCY